MLKYSATEPLARLWTLNRVPHSSLFSNSAVTPSSTAGAKYRTNIAALFVTILSCLNEDITEHLQSPKALTFTDRWSEQCCRFYFWKGLQYRMCWQLKPAGTLCRESSNSCDLPEFCTGANPHCPANVYLHDGHACHSVEGYCYNGICQTHEQQCITLWGPGKLMATNKLVCVHSLLYRSPSLLEGLHFVFSLFVCVCRSQARPWDMLWACQLCRGSLWELWERLQGLLCQVWCEVRLCSCTDAVEVQRNRCAKHNWLA